MINMGLLNFYLGLKIECNQENQKIKSFQLVYINKILSKLYFEKIHSINMPIKKSAIFEQKTNSKVSFFKKKQYQDITGSLIFLIG